MVHCLAYWNYVGIRMSVADNSESDFRKGKGKEGLKQFRFVISKK